VKDGGREAIEGVKNAGGEIWDRGTEVRRVIMIFLL